MGRNQTEQPLFGEAGVLPAMGVSLCGAAAMFGPLFQNLPQT